MPLIRFCPGTFLSTLSLRRATTWARGSRVTYVISIHALLAESDGKPNKLARQKLVFLSTLSLRRATAHTARNTSIAGHFYPRSPCGERLMIREPTAPRDNISIHALLAESDTYLSILLQKYFNFYPRSPCGERQ